MLVFLWAEKILLWLRTQAGEGADWQIDRGAAEGGGGPDQRVNGMPFLPRLPQISPIAYESQAWLASGRPAGTAGPAHELLSAPAQMALRRCSPDTSTDEEWEGGQGRKKLRGGGVCVYVCGSKVKRTEGRKSEVGRTFTMAKNLKMKVK